MRIQIITDSASDITAPNHENLTVLPMTIHFPDREYLDGVTITHQEFYEKLVEGDALPTTSQLTPYQMQQEFQKVREQGDKAIMITLAGKLSGTYQSACLAAQDFEDCVYVVDSENVSAGERVLVEYACCLAEKGMEIEELVETLNREKKKIRILALLDTLDYLKKGGRISRSVAIAAGLLSIKPVVTVEDGEIVLLGKARGSRQGNNFLTQLVRDSGIDFSRPLYLGYTGMSDRLLRKYIEDSKDLWQDRIDTLEYSTIGATIGTHTGPDAIAVAFFATK